MAAVPTMWRAMGLRLARFLKKLLFLAVALTLVFLVFRLGRLLEGSGGLQGKMLPLFHGHSLRTRGSQHQPEIVWAHSPAPSSSGTVAVGEKLEDRWQTEEKERAEEAEKEKVEEEEGKARVETGVKEGAEMTEREKSPGQERAKVLRQKAVRMKGEKIAGTKKRGVTEKKTRDENADKGKSGRKEERMTRRPAGRRRKKKEETGVQMFYNASIDSFQPLWQEPKFLGGKRRNLTIVMYNLPSFVSLWLWNDKAYQARCNVSCTFTSDLSLLGRAHAVVFFAVKMPHLNKLPYRPPGQVWILWAHEGPNYLRGDAFRDSMWHHQINWTMNYRLDADFWYPYYFFVKSDSPYRINLTAVVAGKSKMAAWVVSNCRAPSQRQRYVEELQKYMPVDVYGKCGKTKIGKENLTAFLTRDYKFYMALENSLCKDYVTEKAIKNMQLAEVVVVVRGGADYSKFLPKHSYIDASKFKSPKELAEYLKFLDNHPEEYIKFFQWKHSFHTTSRPPVCSLCLRLQEPERNRKTYPDVWAWYHEGQCNDTRHDF